MMSSTTIWTISPQAMFVTDSAGHVSDANPAAEFLTGVSARSMVGRTLAEILTAPGEMNSALEHLRHSAAVLTVSDLPVRLPNGRKGRAHIKMVPHNDAILTTLDLEGAAASPSAQSGLHAAVGMAQMLAHEIKNPLAGISGAAQLLEMSLNEEERDMTRLIVAESQRIVTLLEQVEQFGEEGRTKPTAFNLHDALRRARHSAALGVAPDLTITEAYDPSLPLALADGDQVVQVLLNLIKNAQEAGASRLTLRSYFSAGLRQRAPDGRELRLPLHIELLDNGPGLPDHIADHVFEPFVTGRTNGTGLGLALVSKLMHDNGGIVSVDSTPDGCCFRLSFQRAPDTIEEA